MSLTRPLRSLGWATLAGCGWWGSPEPAAPDLPGGTEASLGADSDDEDGVWLDDRGRPVLGKWRVVKHQVQMTEQQRAAAAELEAIGYADGTREVQRPSQVVPLHDPARAWQGVNLYHAGHTPEVYLIDMSGERLHTWRTTYTEAFGRPPPKVTSIGANEPRRVALGDEGELYWVFEGRGLARTEVDGSVTWGVLEGAHHDVTLLPEGRLVVLERRAAMHEAFSADRPVLLDRLTIRERSTGEAVRRVNLVDALLRAGRRDVFTRDRGDLLHTNSVQQITAAQERAIDHPAFVAGHFLVSMRNIHTIGIVDSEARVFTWLHTGPFVAQHEALLTDQGELFLFDNRGLGGGQSQVLVHDAATMEVRWSWRGPSEHDPLWSPTLSLASPLPNGNVLVVEGEGGRAFEVTRPGGEVVWQMHCPHRAGDRDQYVAALFDLQRLPRSHPGVVAAIGTP